MRLYDIAKKPCTDFLKTGGSAICRSDGLFESKQCDETNCWCVNVLNGQPDKRTTQDKNIQLDCGKFKSAPRIFSEMAPFGRATPIRHQFRIVSKGYFNFVVYLLNDILWSFMKLVEFVEPSRFRFRFFI